MTHLLSGEGGGLYSLVLDGFVLKLVFRITHFVYIPFFYYQSQIYDSYRV